MEEECDTYNDVIVTVAPHGSSNVFSVKTIAIEDGKNRSYEVIRCYEDIKWLQSVVVSEFPLCAISTPPPLPSLLFATTKLHRMFCERLSAFLTSLLTHPLSSEFPVVWTFLTADSENFVEVRSGVVRKSSRPPLSPTDPSIISVVTESRSKDLFLDDVRNVHSFINSLRHQLDSIEREKTKAQKRADAAVVATQSASFATDMLRTARNSFDIALPSTLFMAPGFVAEAQATEGDHPVILADALLRYESMTSAIVSLCDRPLWNKYKQEITKLERSVSTLISKGKGEPEELTKLTILEESASHLLDAITRDATIAENEMNLLERKVKGSLLQAVVETTVSQVNSWTRSQETWKSIYDDFESNACVDEELPEFLQ